MNNRLYTVLILIVSALMLAAAVIALRSGSRLQPSEDETEPIVEECLRAEPGDTADEPDTRTADSRPAKNRKSGKTLDERNKAKFDVGEMRNELEEMVRKFRGTPEERQEVIEECEGGKELIRLFADLSESSIEKMSPEELEKERENFEKEYRAQLDYIQTGQLQRMLKTPEEEEVIGSTIDAVQEFLERIDGALHSAGY
jgi:flagellar biosynthesis GTPase FlhF